MSLTRRWLLVVVALLAVCAAPVFLLLRSAAPVTWRIPIEICRLRDGRVFFGAILPSGAADVSEGALRIYRGDDGSGREFLSVAVSDLVGRAPAPDAWVFGREDGPTVMGIPTRLRLPGREIGPGDSLASALEHVPAILRHDRSRLAREVRRQSDDPRSLHQAGLRWARWLERDDSTLLDVADAQGRISSLRLSGVVRAERSAAGRDASGLGAVARRLERLVLAPPGPWGGGGVGPAILSVLQLTLFSGAVAGFFGCAAAFWMRDWSRHPGWRRRSRELVAQMAGVPGVVWGVVGAGLLIHGFGATLDRILVRPGGGVLWGGGGLLWSSLTLGAFATPIVSAQVLDELDRLPQRWIETLWTCGATELQLARMLLRHARRGLVAAILSGMARAAGETAPLLLTGALHSSGGLLLATGDYLRSLAGGYLHPGALALDPPWGGLDAELGQPVVAFTLLGLAVFCIALDLAASLVRRRAPESPEVLP